MEDKYEKIYIGFYRCIFNSFKYYTNKGRRIK